MKTKRCKYCGKIIRHWNQRLICDSCVRYVKEERVKYIKNKEDKE